MRITVGDADYEVVGIPVPATTASEQGISGAGFIVAFAFAETGGAAVAEVDVYDGGGTNGALVLPVRLPAGGFASGHPGLPGYPIETGVWLALVSGSVKGSLAFARRITPGATRP